MQIRFHAGRPLVVVKIPAVSCPPGCPVQAVSNGIVIPQPACFVEYRRDPDGQAVTRAGSDARYGAQRGTMLGPRVDCGRSIGCSPVADLPIVVGPPTPYEAAIFATRPRWHSTDML